MHMLAIALAIAALRASRLTPIHSAHFPIDLIRWALSKPCAATQSGTLLRRSLMVLP